MWECPSHCSAFQLLLLPPEVELPLCLFPGLKHGSLFLP